MTQDLTTLRNLIEIGAKELGPDAARLADDLLAVIDAGGDPALQRAQAEPEAEGERADKAPYADELWAKASKGGFAHSFADLLQWERPDGNKLTKEQAFYTAWYGIYQRTGGNKLLQLAGLPTNITAVAAYLGVSRTVVYKWMAADWFNKEGVDSWLAQSLAQMMPDAMRMLHRNINSDNVSGSNAAIKLAAELRQQQVGPAQNPVLLQLLQIITKNIDMGDLDDETISQLAEGTQNPVAVLANPGSR